ncbi:polyprenyl synthetase family protein [Petroclostridium sp. X23]|uniref:polyprenyl synthetase family protein n=1 Tax=Petroclostridium sp. X23 TaxID=3045146 RepID=UPI0024ACD005|nr:farnesyl diphosphate synthase [Petroclostridium sp. X23]WHH59636.1 polyprenyl synthetase family protein [Petroclostridium sp. X23]
MNFKERLNDDIRLIDKYLDIYLPQKENYQKNIYEAMRYSLFAGGKRLRPVITLACCELMGGNREEAVPAACAIEMIHTYSLIHDDLPAMDNDDYRRGNLTNHKVFGEAMAILAGDALLNKAFEVAVDESVKKGVEAAKVIRVLSVIANAGGTEGMIGGQVVDMEAENKKIEEEHLSYMHLHKTGALIIASAKAGAIIGNATKEQMDAITTYSKNIGLAFQVKDDILDVEGDQDKLGKPIGSDINNNKSTFVSLLGLERSKEKVKEMTDEAIKSLNIFGERGWFLKDLALYLINREK